MKHLIVCDFFAGSHADELFSEYSFVFVASSTADDKKIVRWVVSQNLQIIMELYYYLFIAT